MNILWKGKELEKISFERVQYAISQPSSYLIINTLPLNEQDCLIVGTTSAHKEETIMNEMLQSFSEKIVILYGKNDRDELAYKKGMQLLSLGIEKVLLYVGGMFEWMLLQDIYGEKQFPTNKKVLDLLKFK